MSIYGEAPSGDEGPNTSLSGGGGGGGGKPSGPGAGAKIGAAWSGLTKNAKIGVLVGACVLFFVVPMAWYFWGTSEGAPVCTIEDPTRCFVPVKKAMTWDDAHSYCSEHYAGLASIHSISHQMLVSTACLSLGVSRNWAADETGLPHGCWIGLHRAADSFGWSDHSTIDYVNWWQSEPNDYGRTSNVGNGHPEGEDAVEMNFGGRGGGWNDDHVEGSSAHNSADCGESCSEFGMLPICQTKAAVQVPNHPLLWKTPGISTEGRFTAVPHALNLEDAKNYCELNYRGLASIHSAAEQSQARSACDKIAPVNSVDGTPHGCWIGYNDRPAAVSALQFMRKSWTTLQHDGPNHLGLWSIRRRPAAAARPTSSGSTARTRTLRTGRPVSRTTGASTAAPTPPTRARGRTARPAPSSSPRPAAGRARGTTRPRTARCVRTIAQHDGP